MPKAVHKVTTKFNAPKHPFKVGLYLLCGEEALFQMTLSSPPIKGGLSPPQVNNTQEQEEHPRARARATPFHGLRP
jgi:hypothetical protein